MSYMLFIRREIFISDKLPEMVLQPQEPVDPISIRFHHLVCDLCTIVNSFPFIIDLLRCSNENFFFIVYLLLYRNHIMSFVHESLNTHLPPPRLCVDMESHVCFNLI